ncbi:MAG TPA: hypothetical protein VF735_06590 [Pyrinomonadaceae bacterium]|jgi:hypothetical protein
MFQDNLFSGRGKIMMALRDSNGNPGAFYYVGETPKLDVNMEVEKEEVQESSSGNDLTMLTRRKAKKGKMSISLRDIQQANLRLLLSGENANQASGSYSGSNYDTFPTGLVVGDYVRLQKKNVSSFVLKDSAGSAATLVLDTDYEIVDADRGLIKILSLGSYTQPFKAQYSYALTKAVTMLTGTNPEYFVWLQGLNTTRSPFAKGDGEFYRVTFDPAKSLALITTEVSSFEIEGDVLRDSTRVDNTAFGGFGRWVYVDDPL